MTNQQIENSVNVLVSFLLKDTKIKDEEIPVIQAGVRLIVNFLQNINTIADNQ